VIDNDERKNLLGRGSILNLFCNSLQETFLKPVIIAMIVFWI